MRDLEKTAKRLFPHRAPPFKNNQPISEEEREAICKLYTDGVPVERIAEKYDRTSARVGQLCRDIKLKKAEERKAAREAEAATIAPASDPACESELDLYEVF